MIVGVFFPRIHKEELIPIVLRAGCRAAGDTSAGLVPSLNGRKTGSRICTVRNVRRFYNQLTRVFFLVFVGVHV